MALALWLLQIAFFSAEQSPKSIGGTFGVEAIVREFLIPAESAAWGQITPQNRGDTHDRQEQRPQNGGLDSMTEFVDDDLGWILWVDKQEHTHTQTAPTSPVGDDASVEPVMGTFAVNEV